MARRVQITKPQRERTAKALAKVVAETFGGYPTEVTSALGDTVSTTAGLGSLSIDVSAHMVSVFFQFKDEMTDSMRGMALRMGGNHYSGKINFHAAPDGKASDTWLEEVVRSYGLHAHKMRQDR